MFVTPPPLPSAPHPPSLPPSLVLQFDPTAAHSTSLAQVQREEEGERRLLLGGGASGEGGEGGSGEGREGEGSVTVKTLMHQTGESEPTPHTEPQCTVFDCVALLCNVLFCCFAVTLLS